MTFRGVGLVLEAALAPASTLDSVLTEWVRPRTWPGQDVATHAAMVVVDLGRKGT
jgi:hypothetical protein